MTKPTKALPLTNTQRHALATAPLPVVHRIPGKTWAGALISRTETELERITGLRYTDTSDDDVVYFPDSHQGV